MTDTKSAMELEVKYFRELSDLYARRIEDLISLQTKDSEKATIVEAPHLEQPRTLKTRSTTKGTAAPTVSKHRGRKPGSKNRPKVQVAESRSTQVPAWLSVSRPISSDRLSSQKKPT